MNRMENLVVVVVSVAQVREAGGKIGQGHVLYFHFSLSLSRFL